jgi:hypothetical protein
MQQRCTVSDIQPVPTAAHVYAAQPSVTTCNQLHVLLVARHETVDSALLEIKQCKGRFIITVAMHCCSSSLLVQWTSYAETPCLVHIKLSALYFTWHLRFP